MLSNTRVAWFNGAIVPEHDVMIPYRDRSWKSGDGAFDMTRTFDGRIFRLQEHVDRFYRTLRYVQIDPGLSPSEMIAATAQVVARNEHLRAPHGDWWVGQRISRGVDAVGDEGWDHTGPNLVIDVTPLPLAARARQYRDGAEVMTTTLRRTGPGMLSPRAKMNNYMNMIVAGQPVKAARPEAWPLLLDENGNLAEGSGSNIFVVSGGALRTPRERYVLPGVSRRMTMDLADTLGIPCTETDIDLFDAATADEIFLTATSLCILPVATFDGAPIGPRPWPGPGPITRRLIDAYVAEVGCDFVQQYLDRIPALPPPCCATSIIMMAASVTPIRSRHTPSATSCRASRLRPWRGGTLKGTSHPRRGPASRRRRTGPPPGRHSSRTDFWSSVSSKAAS